MTSKILTPEIFLKGKNFKNKKIVLTSGVFDVVHLGHIDYLNEASKLGDILVVALTEDKFVRKGPYRPYFSIKERVEFLQSLSMVDYIIVSNSYSPTKIISLIKPSFYVKGQDYKDQKQDITGNIAIEKKLVKKYGGQFVITKGRQFSSSKIINNESDILNENSKKFLKKINTKSLFNKFSNELKIIKESNLVLFGEPIIDEFTYVETRGKSQKSNILSTAFLERKTNLGGILIIASHLSTFLKKVVVIIVGKLPKEIKEKLPNNVEVKEISSDVSSIIKKNRYVDYYNKSKLFQINHNDIFSLDKKTEKKIIKIINFYIKKKYKFVLADFGHGLFSNSITKYLNSKKIHKYINCQSNSSNYGYNIFTKFVNGKVICVDENEFRLSCQDRTREINFLIKKNKKLFQKYSNLVVTMGKNGCYFSNRDQISFTPTIFKNQLDTVGSGDAFFVGMIICDHINLLTDKEKSVIAHVFGGLHSNVFGNEKFIRKIDVINTLKYILK